MKRFQDQRVLILGLGESGLACARWSISHGAKLTVLDTRAIPPGFDELKALGVEFECFNSFDRLSWPFDRVCLSPGLSPKNVVVQQVVQAAQLHQIAIESEVSWFVDALENLAVERNYCPKVIGVTGTNGKTTTVRMVATMIESLGHSVCCAGNISPSLLHALDELMKNNALPEFWVLELSSFQLHWTDRLNCDSATVLNLTEDHLDWHDSMQEYAQDKARIFNEQTVRVINRDGYDAPLPLQSSVLRHYSFGLGVPKQAGEFGLVDQSGVTWLAFFPWAKKDLIDAAQAQSSSLQHPHLLLPTDALQVHGLHNALNALAALALCEAINLPITELLNGLRNYLSEPHRLNYVCRIEGIDFFNDSKGTNVGATVAALSGFSQPVILIAGGLGKGQNFQPLVKPIKQRCKAVVLLGQEIQSLQNTLISEVAIHHVANMAQAVDMAASLATEGDCVVLSPACSSQDMFANYIERGNVFVEAVKEYAMQRGQVC